MPCQHHSHGSLGDQQADKQEAAGRPHHHGVRKREGGREREGERECVCMLPRSLTLLCPLALSQEMQKIASRRFRMTPAKALEVAEKLYQTGCAWFA
jgi:hypothetical protein